MNAQAQVPAGRDRGVYRDAPVAAIRPDSAAPFADDLRVVIETLRARGWIVAATLCCAMAAGAVWIRYATPMYTATATIVLDPPKQVVPSSPSVIADVAPESSVVDTQVQVLQSRLVIGRVVDALGLQAIDNGGKSSRDDVIDFVRDNLSVSRVGLSHALAIEYEDRDAAQAARVANGVAKAYLDQQLEARRRASKDASQWLGQSVEDLRGQVVAAEAKVEAYRAQSGLLVAKGATSTESELTDVDVSLSAARKDMSDAQARLSGYEDALKKFGATSAVEVFSTPMMQDLRGRYVGLANQKAQLSPTLGESHPQMVEIDRQISGLQQQMNAEAQRTVDELRSEVTILAKRVDGLTAIRDRSRRQLATDNTAGIELVQLQTAAQSLRGLYEAMLTRLQQTAAQESLGQVNATIVSEAIVPLSPSRPRKGVVLVVAAMVGTMLGAAFALLTQLFERKVVRPEDLERRTGLPLLALVPRLKKADLKVGAQTLPIADVVFGKPMSLFTEAFRNLRVAVLGMAERGGSVVVQITSSTFAEGKTVCAIAFAGTAALDGKRVLLIDADTRRRSLTHCLGIEAKTGVVEVLRGKANLTDAIVPGGSPRRPHVLPLAKNDFEPYDLFSTPAFEQLLEKLRKGFDVIVIDSAPVLALAEPISIASRVDAVVLLTRWSKTPIDVVLKALEEIQRAGGHVIGTLLTQVDVKRVSSRAYGRHYYPALMKYYR